MADEEAELDAKYNTVRLNVISSNSITGRTTLAIKTLRSGPENGKSSMVILKAKGHVANKLISIIEIVKRDFSKRKVKLYQYNSLTMEKVEVKPKQKKTVQEAQKNGETGADYVSAVEEEDAFETMGAANGLISNEPQVRNLPILTVYLTCTPVRQLADRYSQQDT